MNKDWQQLAKMTDGKPVIIQRVKIEDEDLAIEGSFELPPLARLNPEDQIFVAVFVKCHGSIKQMEAHFGISYPTVKNRLNRIGTKLEFVEVETVTEPKSDLLARLERGEITVDETIESIKKGNTDE